jgi:hypothetical protein
MRSTTGGASAVISVYARDSINALAVPFPKYSGSDGLVLAVRYKDFNFLGSMEAAFHHGRLLLRRSRAERRYRVLGCPSGLWGGAWDSSLSADVSIAEGVDPIPNVNAAFERRMAGRMARPFLDVMAPPSRTRTYALLTDIPWRLQRQADGVLSGIVRPLGVSAAFLYLRIR